MVVYRLQNIHICPMPIILAIESSCDDTSAAIIQNGKILANIATAQIVHEAWGGVVPELASREHLKQIVAVVDSAFIKSGIDKSTLDAIAFTRGPGLIGSLMVGVAFAKAMGLALNIPLIEVHHMQAHVLANFIDHTPPFPHICLTVSGGHTQIVMVESPSKMRILGQTIDDAAGEAFDKIAKIIGLPYPGGPLLDKHAQNGDSSKFTFAEAKIDGLDFSFSGLKTSVLYFIQKQLKINPDFISQNLDDLCASVQKRIVDTLISKVEKAALENNIQHISLAGGVSANSSLRASFIHLAKENGWQSYVPKFEYCTDNAAMIAMSAHFKFEAGEFCNQDVEPQARIPFAFVS
jgi:N6-L-threonylcarbamoyladenine synthase